MWIIIMWLSIGAVTGVALLYLGLIVLDTMGSKQSRARAQVDQERRDAEHRLRAITQAAMQEMLSLARRHQ